MKPTKTQQKRLLSLAKTVLTHRRNGKVGYEQSAWERLDAYCQEIGLLGKSGIGAGEVIEQAKEHLQKTSIAASMNGLV
jgi:hypothetical protein